MTTTHTAIELAARLREVVPDVAMVGLEIDPDRVVAQLRKDVLPPLSKLAVIHDRPVSPLLYLHYATRPLRPVARLLGWRPPPPATHAPEGVGGPPRTGPPQGSLDSAHGQGPWTGSARAVRPAP